MSNLGKLAKGSLLTSNGTDNTYLTIGSNTEVLTADSTAPTGVKWASPSSGGITTINGDSGSITGSTVTIYANNASLGAGSTVKFTNSSATSTFSVSDASNNTIAGAGAGNLTISGANNAGLGALVLAAITSGNSNVAMGSTSLTAMQDGSNNIAIGTVALQNATTGDGNIGIGAASLQNLATGGANIAIGTVAGQGLTTSDSSNILIGNAGVAGNNGAIKIGTNGTHTSCEIQGISGVTVTGAAVLCSTTGVLGTVVSSIKFKDNVQDMVDESDCIHKLRPVTFEYKSDVNKVRHVGLIAEEVEKINKDLVVYDALGECHSVKYHDLPILLVQEIQKLLKRIEMLEKTQKP